MTLSIDLQPNKGDREIMIATKGSPQNAVDTFTFQHHDPTARILIVDDEADIRFPLARILRLEGYLADETGSGVEALNLLAEHKYDVMVLDLRMPGIHGLEIMHQVHQIYPELLTIILTGQATLESAIAATKQDGVIDYLQKPVSNDKFIEAIGRALHKQNERRRQQQLVRAAAQMLTAMQPSSTGPLNGAADHSSDVASSLQDSAERFIHVRPLTLDRHKRLVTVTNNPTRVIELTKGEAAILACLMLNPNYTISCYELVVNGLGYEVGEEEAESVVRPYIFRLRRKLEAQPKNPKLICTVRRKGYRFISTGD